MTSVISGPTVAIYRQNLEFFQVFAPSIYQRILESDNKHPTFLEISGGDFDVEITNKQFYGGGAFKFTQSQVEVFWKNQPNRDNQERANVQLKQDLPKRVNSRKSIMMSVI